MDEDVHSGQPVPGLPVVPHHQPRGQPPQGPAQCTMSGKSARITLYKSVFQNGCIVVSFPINNTASIKLSS